MTHNIRVPYATGLGALALLGLLVSPPPAFGQFQGENFRGDYGVDSGTQGPPGFYLLVPLARQRADRVKDSQGNSILSDTFQHFDLQLFLPTIYEVTSKKLFGGNYGFTVTPPFTNYKPQLPTEENLISGWGLSDLYVSPLVLGWTTSHADFITGYAFDAPTGRYEAGAADNFGLGMWSHEIQAGTTVYFDSAQKVSVATTGFFEMHTKKKDLDLRVGNILTLEGGAGYHVPKIGGVFGVGYTLQAKMSDDSGADVPVTALRLLRLYGKNRVFSIGPDLTTGLFEHGRTVGFLNVRYFWESAARSTTEGSTFFIGFNIARLAN
jgi:hypothetical protein